MATVATRHKETWCFRDEETDLAVYGVIVHPSKPDGKYHIGILPGENAYYGGIEWGPSYDKHFMFSTDAERATKWKVIGELIKNATDWLTKRAEAYKNGEIK